MNLWTSEDISRILLQLDKQNLPFKKYELTVENGLAKLIGRGGSANVYEAHLRKNGKGSFALKVIGFSNQNVDDGLFFESVAAQKSIGLLLNNVVKVYEFKTLWVTLDENDNVITTEDERPDNLPRTSLRLQFILMEKVDSVIERTKVGNIRMTPPALGTGEEKEILKLAYDIGLALRRAHEVKVLHRDVKLENVFYSPKDKEYKLGDFGIAKFTDDGFAGTVAFTKGYAAPEVRGNSENDRYDSTADIYSYGMMLYVLANRLKFPDSNTYNVNAEAQYSKGYILPPPDNADISEEFYYIMAKACMYDPEDRYGSVEEMLIDISQLLYGEKMSYRREHKMALRVLSFIFLIIAVPGMKYTTFLDVDFKLYLWDYIFLAAGIGKTIMAAKKKTTASGFLYLFTLAVGVYLMISQGGLTMPNRMMWWGAAGLTILIMLLNRFAIIPSALMLYLNVLTLIQGLIPFDRSRIFDYSWVPVVFASLFFFFGTQYIVLCETSRNLIYPFLKKGGLWAGICAIYGLAILVGLFKEPFVYVFNIIGINKGWIMYFETLDLTMVGIVGLLICLSWIGREKIILLYKKWQRKWIKSLSE